MIKFTNIIAVFLKFYRYRNKKDPFEIFQQLVSSEIKQKKLNKSVLLLPLRVSPVSNVVEGIFGYALKLRGYDVSALMCGQAITKCENINQRSNFSLSCALCNYEQKRFSSTYGIKHIEYEDEISIKEKLLLFNLSKTVNLKDIFNYKYKNVNIGKYVEGGVTRYLLLSNIDINKHEKLIREYFFTALMTACATKSVLKKTNPKFVIASHGIYSTWGVAMETCISDGYHIVIYGRGYVGKGNLVFSHNNSYLFDTINETSSYWINNNVSGNSKEKLDEYFQNKRNPSSSVDHVNYYSNIKEEEKEDIFTALKLDKSRKRIGIYPNIPWDGKMFSATENFPDLNVFVQAVLEWAKINPNVDLIIRAHPAEAYRKGNESIERFIDILNNECINLPKNIIYIEPTASINSYQLSEICSASLMYASTLALEFAYVKHPVIQVGLNNVSNKGLIFDAPTKLMMFEYLDKAILNKLIIDDKMYSNIIKYADYWIHKRHVPETLLNLEHLTFQGYTFDDTKKLSKGNYKVLDWFIDRCEDGKPFIWENDA